MVAISEFGVFMVKRIWSIAITCFLACESLARPLDAAATKIRPSELLAAPQIILGQVIDVREVRKDFVRRGTPIEVMVSEAVVKVDLTIRGHGSNTVQILNLLAPVNPASYFGYQILAVSKRYVFFLSPAHAAGSFEAISPYRFGLEVEQVHLQPIADSKEAIREIAVANSESTNRFIADVWVDFLEGIYDKDKDLRFWMARAQDSRLKMKGKALVVLVENSAEIPGLYTNVLNFLNDTASLPTQGQARNRLSELLSKLCPGGEPKAEDFRVWLSSAAKEPKKAALALIRTRIETRLVPNIVELMKRSEDWEIQYECLKTLSALKDVPLISYPEFLKRREEYIAKWQN